jgi:lipoyl(octanoyl) transferase
VPPTGNRSTSEAGAAPCPPVWVVSFPGLVPYREAWDLQRRLWTARHAGRIPDTLLFLEHEPVVTLGKNAHRENLLLDAAGFQSRGVEVVEVDRGGDVTWHGPGQLVGYWIFDLRALYQDVHRYLREIEEVLIRVLARHRIEAVRSAGATGVWVGNEKVAAIGMHLSHWVSTHGFALNLSPDLAAFSWIVPCGLRGRGVTSMHRLTGGPVLRPDVEREVIEEMTRLFAREAHRLAPHELYELLLDAEGRRPGPDRASSPAGGAPAMSEPELAGHDPGEERSDSGRRGTECRV